MSSLPEPPFPLAVPGTLVLGRHGDHGHPWWPGVVRPLMGRWLRFDRRDEVPEPRCWVEYFGPDGVEENADGEWLAEGEVRRFSATAAMDARSANAHPRLCLSADQRREASQAMDAAAAAATGVAAAAEEEAATAVASGGDGWAATEWKLRNVDDDYTVPGGVGGFAEAGPRPRRARRAPRKPLAREFLVSVSLPAESLADGVDGGRRRRDAVTRSRAMACHAKAARRPAREVRGEPNVCKRPRVKPISKKRKRTIGSPEKCRAAPILAPAADASAAGVCGRKGKQACGLNGCASITGRGGKLSRDHLARLQPMNAKLAAVPEALGLSPDSCAGDGDIGSNVTTSPARLDSQPPRVTTRSLAKGRGDSSGRTWQRNASIEPAGRATSGKSVARAKMASCRNRGRGVRAVAEMSALGLADALAAFAVDYEEDEYSCEAFCVLSKRLTRALRKNGLSGRRLVGPGRAEVSDVLSAILTGCHVKMGFRIAMQQFLLELDASQCK